MTPDRPCQKRHQIGTIHRSVRGTETLRVVVVGAVALSPDHRMVTARTQLHYGPRYRWLATVREALTWMMDTGHLLGYGGNPAARPI
jgi:hypothetical protein